VKQLLFQLNAYDLELYEYAKKLLVQRQPGIKLLLSELQTTKRLSIAEIDQEIKRNKMACPQSQTCKAMITPSMKNVTGFFRPVGHKLPVNSSFIEKPGVATFYDLLSRSDSRYYINQRNSLFENKNQKNYYPFNNLNERGRIKRNRRGNFL
jgi:hypothetical protein